ncbi:MAG: PhoPQ-activated protein PqaA family protein, partial [Enterobacteriaceae bacterium]
MRDFISRCLFLLVILLTIQPIICSAKAPALCNSKENSDIVETLNCASRQAMQKPLQYHLISEEKQTHLDIRHYDMVSQSWSPHSLVTPALWHHSVDLYIPQQVVSHKALLYINNGINNPTSSTSPVKPTDLSADALADIATATHTVVVSLNDNPNQYLVWQNDGIPRREDASVAKSWQLFLEDPDKNRQISLHIPMTIAARQAMNLVQKELSPEKVSQFIVSGASKRAWVSWLTAIADPRVDAIVPFAFDMLNTRLALQHIYRSYGNHWPVAFAPYVQDGVADSIDSSAFLRLMQIEDPLQYSQTVYGPRLAVTKYIVNNSGDDFYVPDNSRFYYDELPGSKALYVVPNSSHYDIKKVIEPTLIAFIHRYQRAVPLPEMTVTQEVKDNQQTMQIHFSEKPQQVLLWSADNPEARDFRYRCGLIWHPTSLPVTNLNTVTASIEVPKK